MDQVGNILCLVVQASYSSDANTAQSFIEHKSSVFDEALGRDLDKEALPLSGERGITPNKVKMPLNTSLVNMHRHELNAF